MTHIAISLDEYIELLQTELYYIQHLQVVDSGWNHPTEQTEKKLEAAKKLRDNSEY